MRPRLLAGRWVSGEYLGQVGLDLGGLLEVLLVVALVHDGEVRDAFDDLADRARPGEPGVLLEEDREEELEVVVELSDEEVFALREELLLPGLARVRGEQPDALHELDHARLDLVVVAVEDVRPDHALLREHFALVDEEAVDLVQTREVAEDRLDHLHVAVVRVRVCDLFDLRSASAATFSKR